MTFDELKARAAKLIERGHLSDAADIDALLAKLAACATEAEIDALKREAQRWEWATRPVEPWVSHENALAMSAN